MKPVPERPLFPQAVPGTFAGVVGFTEVLVKQLVATFQEVGFRLNRTLPSDGSEAMTGPLSLMSYTVAGLPAAADYEGAAVYVSDETGGAVLAFSDGTDWRRSTDRAVVS